MKKFFLFLVIFFFAFASCKKDKENNTCSISEANLVGSYKVTSIKYKASSSATEEDYMDQFFDACEKDDIITLNSNHTYTSADAGTTCTPDGSYDGIWSLSGNTVSVDGDPATIENFSCDGFTGVTTGIFIPGDKITFTYARQ